MREAQRVRRRNVTIGVVLGLVLVLAAAIWAYTGVTGSYYLGTYQGNVAVWRGLPGKPLGLKLHWLESETSIKLSDLPEDTQTASRRAFRKQVSTMRRTRYPSTATRSTRSRPAR